MNHAYHPAAREGTPLSCSGLVGRLRTAITKTFRGQDDPPVHVGGAYTAPEENPLWTVTGTLTRKAGFGSISAETLCWVGAETQTEAIGKARAQLLEAHPGFSVSSIRASKPSAA